MSHPRPVLTIPRSRQTSLLNIAAIAGCVVTVVLALHAWSVLPETIPVHFGFDGRPNGWGSKGIVWLFPLLSVLNYAGLSILRRYPHTFNYLVKITEQNASRQYQIACWMLDWLNAELIWLLAYIEWQILVLATASNSGLGLWFLPVVIAIILGTNGFWLWRSLVAR